MRRISTEHVRDMRAAALALACAAMTVCIPASAQESIAPAAFSMQPFEPEAAVKVPDSKPDATPAARHRKSGPPNPKHETRKSGSAKPLDVPSPAPAAANAVQAPTAQSGAATPALAATPIGEFEPVVHARNAKIGLCMDNIVGQSARVIDRPHQAASTWVTDAPNENVFSSIISLSYPNKVTPNGAAVILAAPLGAGKCQGQSVQIYPTARSCTAVQASLIQIGKTIGTLENLPLLQLKDGSRNLLMPTAGGGCVVVTVQLRQ